MSIVWGAVHADVFAKDIVREGKADLWFTTMAKKASVLSMPSVKTCPTYSHRRNYLAWRWRACHQQGETLADDLDRFRIPHGICSLTKSMVFCPLRIPQSLY